MADETPVTPDPETPEQEIPEAVCINKLRLHSSKIYPQASVDILVQKVATDSEARDNALEQTITNNKTEASTAIQSVRTELSTQIAATKSELEQKIEEGGGGTGTDYKGVVEHESELEEISARETIRHGDWYIARDTGKSWVWTVKDGIGSWVQMSSTVDLSNYPTKDDVYLKAYIDALVNRVTAAEAKLNKITTALGELLNTEALVYETYTADDLFRRTNTLLRVLKAAVAVEEPEPEPEPEP